MTMNESQADAMAVTGRDPSPRGDEPDKKASSSGAEVFAVLKLIVPLAVCAIAATVLGRALAPSWAGLAVGMNRAVHAMELVGSASTQLFALAVTVVAVGCVVSMTRSQAPWALRILSIVSAGFAILVGASAAAVPITRLPLGVSAFLISVLALACAWDAKKAHFARPAAFMLGIFGLASLTRLTSILLTSYAVSSNPPRPPAMLLALARGAATGSFVLEVVAAFALVIIIAQGSRKLANPTTTAALLLAFVLTRQASLGHLEDAGTLSILFHRAADRFLSLPEPYVPAAPRVFLVFFALILSGFVLFARRQVPALAGAMSLLLLARSNTDMPLGALSMAVASMAIALAARDQRGLWAAIANEETKTARTEGQTWVRPPKDPEDRAAYERSAEVELPKDSSEQANKADQKEDGPPADT